MPKRDESLKSCGDWTGIKEGVVWKGKHFTK